ncbi:MAG: anaerobic ribonucleoside-triphosphate reductase [Candidatus Woesearchaeota archaeon]
MSTAEVIKANGKREPFSEEKLSFALARADVPKKDIDRIVAEITQKVYNLIPTSQLRKWVIDELDKIDPKYSHGFKYKKKEVHVVGGFGISQLKDVYETFQKQKIVDSLIRETGMPQEVAEEIANEAEHFLIETDIRNISGSMIREIVNYILISRNLEKYYADYTKIGMPVFEITRLMSRASHDNANQQYNPETVHKLIADTISRSYSLTKDLPQRLRDAHIHGELHIHDLDYFSTRPFCFSYDLRFFLQHGLKPDGTGVHAAMAGPAQSASVAILHAAKILACGQVNCAGGQGFNWFNVILAPYLRGLDYKQIKQMAQMFIYEMSMMYVSRGGQVVFSSIDIEPGIPKTLANVPAVQPGGKVSERVTYSDYHDEANKFFRAITEVYNKGDFNGKPFSFPKYELKVSKEDFSKYPEEMRLVSELAAKNGAPYYFVQQDYLPEYSCYQCCAYLMPLSEQNTDDDVFNGTVRGGGLQVVTINLPQIAYEAKGNDDKLFTLLRDRMDKAKEVMHIKQEIIRRRMEQGLLPFLSQPIDNKGTPYLLVDKQGLEIGMVGLNEMLKAHIGKELHESKEAWSYGLKVIQRMKEIAAEYKKETGYLFGISRTPAETAAYRLAKIDMKKYPNAVVQGDKTTEAVYYTNSTHIRPSANVALGERIKTEGSFHPLLDAGAMSHVWLGEGAPDPESITKLTERIARNTLTSYFAYTRDLTICNNCLFTVAGVLHTCPKCKSKNIDWLSRITGYYQRVSTWNKGKRQEFLDRQRYTL